jgi:Restriction endonuclease
MKKDGKALQQLVRAIESALAAGNETIKVDMERRFPDKVTGKLREHDVVLIITHQHHETIIALECRDRSRPVGVDAVEAFHTKCEDTGIHSGIMVSAKGFYGTAIEKAVHHNIRCLTLDEAERFDWCAAAGLKVARRHIQHVSLYVIFPDGPEIPKDAVQTEDGTQPTSETALGWGANALNQSQPITMEEPGEYRKRFLELNPKLYGVRDGNLVQANRASDRGHLYRHGRVLAVLIQDIQGRRAIKADNPSRRLQNYG